MSFRNLLYIIFVFTGLICLSIQQTGCSREYSYEGGRTDTTIITDTTSHNDSVPISDSIIYCALCNEADSMVIGSWNFKNNQSYFCGINASTVFVQNSGFTFFGPSACSVDTGLVVTVYLPEPLDEDKFNLSASDVAFYYYDHKGTADMFIKLPPLPFSLTVSSYIKSTGIVKGSFEGVVYKPNGDTTSIRNGRFLLQLK